MCASFEACQCGSQVSTCVNFYYLTRRVSGLLINCDHFSICLTAQTLLGSCRDLGQNTIINNSYVVVILCLFYNLVDVRDGTLQTLTATSDGNVIPKHQL